MKEHPILFSGEMVQAILAGRKTQTRRVVSQSHLDRMEADTLKYGKADYDISRYGAKGDVLWVRETWLVNAHNETIYCADWKEKGYEYRGFGWKPSIHMPRWASRICLEVVNIRVERLQNISEEDIAAEGVEACLDCDAYILVHKSDEQHWRTDDFVELWNSINGKRGYGWETNPYVWAVEFRKLP
jgi:hypothetical protein